MRLLEHPASLFVLILVIVVLLGYKRLPDVARNLGRSTRVLKSEVDALKNDDTDTGANRVEPVDAAEPLDAVRRDSRLSTHAHTAGSKAREVKEGLDSFKDGLSGK